MRAVIIVRFEFKHLNVTPNGSIWRQILTDYIILPIHCSFIFQLDYKTHPLTISVTSTHLQETLLYLLLPLIIRELLA